MSFWRKNLYIYIKDILLVDFIGLSVWFNRISIEEKLLENIIYLCVIVSYLQLMDE